MIWWYSTVLSGCDTLSPAPSRSPRLSLAIDLQEANQTRILELNPCDNLKHRVGNGVFFSTSPEKRYFLVLVAELKKRVWVLCTKLALRTTIERYFSSNYKITYIKIAVLVQSRLWKNIITIHKNTFYYKTVLVMLWNEPLLSF